VLSWELIFAQICNKIPLLCVYIGVLHTGYTNTDFWGQTPPQHSHRGEHGGREEGRDGAFVSSSSAVAGGNTPEFSSEIGEKGSIEKG